MEWIVKASNDRNEDRRRHESITRGAPTLWENICREAERAVRFYQSMADSDTVEFSGCANHVIWIAMFESRKPEKVERERVTITFNEQQLEIVVRSSLDASVKVFSIGLNQSGHVSLMEEKKELPVEKFVETALRGAFFPRVT